MEIKSYLKCELKMLPSEIEKLNITRIFPPAKQDWNVLYVEFGNEFEVDTIFSYTKNMTKKDHRVIHWIPKQMYARFRAVESLAYTIRKEEGLKTRVKIGKTDFLLLTRDPSSPVWSRRQLPSSFPEACSVSCSSSSPAVIYPTQNSATASLPPPWLTSPAPPWPTAPLPSCLPPIPIWHPYRSTNFQSRWT